MRNKLFKIGEPIPSIWLHMEFDFNDTTKYLGGVLVSDQKEADRLEKKYNS